MAKKLLHIDEKKDVGEQICQILLDVFIEYFFMERRRPLREMQNILEKAILIKVLFHVDGKQTEAAKFLGIKKTTLNEKIKKHNIKFFKGPIKFPGIVASARGEALRKCLNYFKIK